MTCNNILHWLFLKLKIQRKVLEELTLGDDLLVCVAENLLELLLIGCRAPHEGQWNAEAESSPPHPCQQDGTGNNSLLRVLRDAG